MNCSAEILVSVCFLSQHKQHKCANKTASDANLRAIFKHGRTRISCQMNRMTLQAGIKTGVWVGEKEGNY